MIKWQRLKYLHGLPLGEDGRRITGSQKHIDLSRKAACEGMVLLKNNNALLPLKKGARVALFGKASADYVKGGGGSGDVTVAYTRNLCDAMDIKEREHKLRVFSDLSDYYRKEVKKQYAEGRNPGGTYEPEVPAELVTKAKSFADVAIISICRFSWEGGDRKGIKGDGDFYLTEAEENMVNTVTDNFDRVVVVLNVGGMVDTSWFKNNDKIEAVLLAWQAGMEGGLAEADILCGDANPSGKLTDTFASCFDDYPSSYNFNESEAYAEYTDDIYVGYRYFETIPGANKCINYPFGYGLSYTTFNVSADSAYEADGVITVNAKVVNTGAVAGKEVVQIYFSAPQGLLGKPKYQLCAFAKTDLLNPGECRVISLKFKVNDMASFDDKGVICKSARVLEKGDYEIFVGNSVENLVKAYTYTLDDNVVTEQLNAYCVPKKLTKRLLSDGSYETCETGEYEKAEVDTTGWSKYSPWSFAKPSIDRRNTPGSKDKIYLEHVANGKNTLDEFMAQLSDEELIDLCGGRPNHGLSNTFCWGDLANYGVPACGTADGPAGLRVDWHTGVTTTAWPCATLLACTWNTDIVEEVGAAGALELRENNLAIWLTPAMNIHRSLLCGRNFEYYSEDPYVTGKMAAAMVRGIQSQHIAASAKHFACNNKETNRTLSDSIVSERALREIYLRGFEICVKEAQPWSIMTSYNIVNGVFAVENKEMINGILRGEWGFEGAVTSDWDTFGEHYREVLAGNDIKMPVGSSGRLKDALDSGLITREDIYTSAKRVLELVLKFD